MVWSRWEFFWVWGVGRKTDNAIIIPRPSGVTAELEAEAGVRKWNYSAEK